MSFFLLCSLSLFFDFFSVLFIFLFFLSFSLSPCWMGVFIMSSGGVFSSLFLLCVLVLCFICLSEKSFPLILISFFLVFFCVLFFFSSNLFLLYFFFELSIFPILFMVLGFGSQVEKVGAAYYLLFYSSFCSFPFLLVLFSVGFVQPVFFFFIFSWEFCLLSVLLFLINFPLYFLHLWLPKVHVEAPTSASILLAGLLLKLGTGGFLRVMPLFLVNFEYWLVLVSSLGVFSCSFLCLLQSDLKALAAYSSINHIMFLLLCLLVFSSHGLWGGLVIMLSHGFVSTLVFFFVGEFFHTSLSRMFYFFGGFLLSNFSFLVFFSAVWLLNSGVPPSVSFFSEYLGTSSYFILSSFTFFLFFFYFFISFYYGLYVLVSCFVGKGLVKLSVSSSFCGLFLVLWGCNFFFFNFFL